MRQLEQTGAAAGLAQADAEQARWLVGLFDGSQFNSELLIAHPDWLTVLDVAQARFPRRKQGLRRELDAALAVVLEARDYPAALRILRQFKQREMMRIAARDLAGAGGVPVITQEISDVADVCLAAMLDVCRRQFTARFGSPWHQDPDGHWQPTQFCVIGLGKLGGQELNYSSDVDVIYVYDEEGSVFQQPPRGK
ncbi:MAG TPA: hypothetical protein VHH73_15300, partial [Verrucomicrobiae bacterium]|nr:hypothetical protein [Verrucomicrobiae bacterium]